MELTLKNNKEDIREAVRWKDYEHGARQSGVIKKFVQCNVRGIKDRQFANFESGYFSSGVACSQPIQVLKPMSFERRFRELAEKWKLETGGYSTLIHKTSNQHYKDIISMGPVVIPFILEDLKQSPVWFSALKELSKQNPVKKEDVGDTKKMRDAWLIWGYDNGLI